MNYYDKETEITPNTLSTGIVKFNDKNEIIDEKINETDFRGIIESQVSFY